MLPQSWGIAHFCLCFQMNWIMTFIMFTHGRFIFKREWETFHGGCQVFEKKEEYLNLKIKSQMPTHRMNIRIIEYSGPALITVHMLKYIYIESFIRCFFLKQLANEGNRSNQKSKIVRIYKCCDKSRLVWREEIVEQSHCFCFLCAQKTDVTWLIMTILTISLLPFLVLNVVVHLMSM